MTKIYEVDQVSGIARATDTHVELFDNGVSLGKVPVDDEGGWTKAVSNLALGTHTYTAKAANGMAASEPWEIQVQSDGENFDAVPDTVLSRGQKIDLPTMTITFDGGDGQAGILPFNYGGLAYPPLPGQREGKTLHMNLQNTGEIQVVKIDFKNTYSKLSFWSSYVKVKVEVICSAADHSYVEGIDLPISSGSEARQSTFSGSNISRVVFTTYFQNWIVLDYFHFE